MLARRAKQGEVSMIRQQTLGSAVTASGVGLHSGKDVRLVLRPAPVDTGIVFRRVDLDPAVEIPARVATICDTERSTSLCAGSVRIATVEHLMAAFGGMGVDNAFVDLDEPEVPIMDGSAWPFVRILQSAGLVKQVAARRYLRITREVKVTRGDKEAGVFPFAGFRVAFGIDYDHPLVSQQTSRCEIELDEHNFIEELSRARTFGFAEEIGHLHARGLALGGSLDNAILLGREGMLNEGGLRYEDELVRHKMLDALGDLYLLGYPLIGEFRAYKSGHTLNRQLLRALLAQRDGWELVELTAADSGFERARRIAS